MKMSEHFIYTFGLSTCAIAAAFADPQMSSRLGKILGINNTVQFGESFYTVHEYVGIPCAKPIRADNRFRKKPERLKVLHSPFLMHETTAQNVLL